MDIKEYFLGIDYGTSNSCVGIYLNSSVNIAPNRIGERSTPSIVLFSEGKIFVGEDTLNQKIEENNLIYEVKRFIGLDYDEFEKSEFSKHLNYVVVNQDGKPKIKVIIKGKEQFYSAEEISAFIIKKMVNSAEDFINEREQGTKITKAVMTVPCHFCEKQKEAVRAAARLADIDVVRIINEPTAAALAYGLGKDLTPENEKKKKRNRFTNIGKNTYEVAPSAIEKLKKEENVIVFDLGGGTFDITLLNLRKNYDGIIDFEVLGTDGDNSLGGSDFDNRIVNYCINKFCKKNDKNEKDIRNDKKICKSLKIKCEAAKKILSISNETFIRIEGMCDGEDFYEKITKNDFENMCQDLFLKIKSIIKNLLKESGKSPEEIDSVILVGGATRMTCIKDLLNKVFGEKKVKDTIDPDEAVAFGATLEYAKIMKKDKINFNLQDIIPYNLGIAAMNPNPKEIKKGYIMKTIIKKYSKIPTSEEEPFKITLNEKNREININVYEGNDKYVENNRRLDVLYIKQFPIAGEINYTVKFDVDVNSNLTVNVFFNSINKTYTKQIKESITNAICDKLNKKIKINKSKSIKPLNKALLMITRFKESIRTSSDINQRLEDLIEISNEYEQLIKNYLVFVNDNDFILEKVYNYTLELFSIYAERINFDKIVDIKISNKNKIPDIIIKIKEGMNNLISIVGYVTSLLDTLFIIRENAKDEFYLILLNFMELMNNEGKKKIKNAKFSRYYSKLYFEKAFYTYKKYAKNYDLKTIDRDLKKKLEEQEEINIKHLKEINSFAIVIESLANEKKFLIGHTGFTFMINQIEKLKDMTKLSANELKELFDLFQNTADSYDPKEKSIEEGYCIANIIKILYKLYNDRNNEKLEKYIDRLEDIMENRQDEKYIWYNEIKEIIKEIENNKK